MFSVDSALCVFLCVLELMAPRSEMVMSGVEWSVMYICINIYIFRTRVYLYFFYLVRIANRVSVVGVYIIHINIVYKTLRLVCAGFSSLPFHAQILGWYCCCNVCCFLYAVL